MYTALLIIDVQEGLCAGEEQCFDSQRVIRTINDLSAKARAIGLPVILVQHEETQGSLVHGSAAWRFADELLVAADDLHVRKTLPDAFYQTDLLALLQARSIDRVVICGFQTDHCIDATVRRAHLLGYEVVLVADAHSTVDNGSMAADQIIANHNNRLGRLSSAVSRIDVVPAARIRL